MLVQEAEVQGFLAGDLQPVQVEVLRHAVEAPDGVQGEIDMFTYWNTTS